MARVVAGLMIAVLLTACQPAPSTSITAPTSERPGESAVAASPTTGARASAETTSQSTSESRLAPGWKIWAEADRNDPLLFATETEVFAWGGRVDFENEFPRRGDGVAWNQETMASRVLPPSPIEKCSHFSSSIWTGTELVVWHPPLGDPGCQEGAVVSYTPTTDSWRLIDVPDFFLAGGDVVWTGQEIVSWRQGLALNPVTGVVRHFAPLEIGQPVFSSFPFGHWTGADLLVVGHGRIYQYESTDRWIELEPPPIGQIAQASAWTGTHLLAVNYQMEAALYDVTSRTWRWIESMPMRFMESIPSTVTGDSITLVNTALSMAALDGDSWLAIPNPAMDRSGLGPYGTRLLTDRWLYQIGTHVLRRPRPVTVGDGIQTEEVIPLQTMLFAIPQGWTARLRPGGSGDHFVYDLAANDGGSCEAHAYHGGTPLRPPEIRAVPSAWEDGARQVGLDTELAISIVNDFERSSDWVLFDCDTVEAALQMASGVWVNPT